MRRRLMLMLISAALTLPLQAGADTFCASASCRTVLDLASDADCLIGIGLTDANAATLEDACTGTAGQAGADDFSPIGAAATASDANLPAGTASGRYAIVHDPNEGYQTAAADPNFGGVPVGGAPSGVCDGPDGPHTYEGRSFTVWIKPDRLTQADPNFNVLWAGSLAGVTGLLGPSLAFQDDDASTGADANAIVFCPHSADCIQSDRALNKSRWWHVSAEITESLCGPHPTGRTKIRLYINGHLSCKHIAGSGPGPGISSDWCEGASTQDFDFGGASATNPEIWMSQALFSVWPMGFGSRSTAQSPGLSYDGRWHEFWYFGAELGAVVPGMSAEQTACAICLRGGDNSADPNARAALCTDADGNVCDPGDAFRGVSSCPTQAQAKCAE